LGCNFVDETPCCPYSAFHHKQRVNKVIVKLTWWNRAYNWCFVLFLFLFFWWQFSDVACIIG
jgi:hypothetical protein